MANRGNKKMRLNQYAIFGFLGMACLFSNNGYADIQTISAVLNSAAATSQVLADHDGEPISHKSGVATQQALQTYQTSITPSTTTNTAPITATQNPSLAAANAPITSIDNAAAVTTATVPTINSTTPTAPTVTTPGVTPPAMMAAASTTTATPTPTPAQAGEPQSIVGAYALPVSETQLKVRVAVDPKSLAENKTSLAAALEPITVVVCDGQTCDYALPNANLGFFETIVKIPDGKNSSRAIPLWIVACSYLGCVKSQIAASIQPANTGVNTEAVK